jgi:predicted DNA-binding transcriptional regulator AlpA
MEQNQQAIAANSKIRRSVEAIQGYLLEQQQSGLSVMEYCEANSISEKTFYRWVKKYRIKAKRKPRKIQVVQSGFAKIEVVGNIDSNHPQLFAEIGKIRLYKEVSVEYLKALLS